MRYRGITVKKNKSCNTWYARPRINGTQVYISAKTQKECYDKLKKTIARATLKVINVQKVEEKPKGKKLVDWFKEWRELYKVGRVKQTTLRDYDTLMKHIPTKLQNQHLTEFSVKDIVDILNNCKAIRQRQKLYDFLKALFEKAKNLDYITKNIVNHLDKPRHEKNHGIALTNKQQQDLIDISKDIKNGDVILIAMYQGLRRGEVLGLTIDNIDFENNTLTINKGWNEYNKFDTTKNEQSIRTIPLFAESKKILLKYKNQKERIFDITNQACTKMIKEVRVKMNIPKLNLKDMRSTFITRCKELNIPKHVIQAWVGHAIGSAVTDTVYTKHNADIDNKYINILNKSKFNSNSTQKKK